MALIVEDGTGVVGAEAYGDAAGADAYWAARPQSPHSATWAAATTPQKEGAMREAADYMDANYGRYYRGTRRGYHQGREWPRSEAKDDAGYDLPDLPPQLPAANYELAARAISAQLSPDAARDGAVKSVGAGPARVEFFGGASSEKKFGAVEMALAPVLNGSQPSAGPQWAWD